MPRFQLSFPGTSLFSTELVVRMSDLNYGGHVGSDRVLTFMQDARNLFYRHLGFESEVKLEGTVAAMIGDAAVVYKSESFSGDVLVIEVAAGDLTQYGFDLYYRITQKIDGKEVAIGKTGIVCVDTITRRVTGVPATLADRLKLTAKS